MANTTPTPAAGEEIGNVLKLLRCRRGWSADDLERASGTAGASISFYECGQADPALKTVIRLVGAMGYPPAALDPTRRYLEAMRTNSYGLAPVVRAARAALSRRPDRSAAAPSALGESAVDSATP